jgi:hypothetical protein
VRQPSDVSATTSPDSGGRAPAAGVPNDSDADEASAGDLSADDLRDLQTREADELASAMRAHPPTRGEASGKPNVVIFHTDDQQFNLFTRELMPNVFREIVDQGVNFQRAYVNHSECCPSRATHLNGI